jgi:hypothetical protein
MNCYFLKIKECRWTGQLYPMYYIGGRHCWLLVGTQFDEVHLEMPFKAQRYDLGGATKKKSLVQTF